MTFGFLSASRNFCKLLCVSWEVFRFARKRLDPLGGQVLHHDCISMIVSRFTTFTENFVICCYQVTKIFCTKYDSTNTFSAGPLADLATSVLREVSPKCSLLVDVGSKDGSWEELTCESRCSGTLSSTWFSLCSCSHSGMSEHKGSPQSKAWYSLLFGFGFVVGLGDNGSPRFVISSTCELDTSTGWESVPLRSSLSRVSLPLNTVVVGEAEEWGKCRMINLLPGRCHGCWTGKAWGRTHW